MDWGGRWGEGVRGEDGGETAVRIYISIAASTYECVRYCILFFSGHLHPLHIYVCGFACACMITDACEGTHTYRGLKLMSVITLNHSSLCLSRQSLEIKHRVASSTRLVSQLSQRIPISFL